MHKIFEIDELLCPVFSFVLAKRDLLNLALTCSTFQRPALDLLWSDLDSIYPLIRLLGELELREVNNIYGENAMSWTFVNPSIPKQKWKTWEAYSARVLSIRLIATDPPERSTHPTDIAAEVLAQVGLSAPRDLVLLPSVRHICLPYRSKLFMFWLPFLHQAEKEVRLRIEVMEEEFFPNLEFTLSEIERRIPKISALEIEGYEELENWNPSLFVPLSEMSHLREIVLPPFGFQHLGTLPLATVSNLQRIRILDGYYHNSEALYDYYASVLEIQLPTNQGQNMINLVTFEVAMPPISLAMLLQDVSWAPQLKELHLVSYESHRQDIQELVATISRCRTGLTSIRFDFSYSVDEQLVFGDISPLLECKSLKIFWLRHELPCLIQGDELEQMLENWPLIEEFAISCEEPDRRFNLDLLNVFAAKAPRIRYIDLPFTIDGPLEWVPNLRLECLEALVLGDASPTDVGEVALYLSCICTLNVEWRSSRTLSSVPYELDPEWAEVWKQFDLLVRGGRRVYHGTRDNDVARSRGWRILTTVPGV